MGAKKKTKKEVEQEQAKEMAITIMKQYKQTFSKLANE